MPSLPYWFLYWLLLNHLGVEKVIRRMNINTMRVEQIATTGAQEAKAKNSLQHDHHEACAADEKSQEGGPGPAGLDLTCTEEDDSVSESTEASTSTAKTDATPADANVFEADASPPPLPPPTVEYFDELQATWRTELEWQLPAESFLDDFDSVTHTFVDRLEEISQAVKVQNEAQKMKDKVAKQKPATADEKLAVSEAKQAASDAEQSLQDTMTACQLGAVDTLQNLSDFLSSSASSFDDSLLVQYTLLSKMSSKRAAEWCQEGTKESESLLRLLLHSADLQRRMLLGGGALGQNYGRAMQLYEQIVESQQAQTEPVDAVLERLALAVALELCVPLEMFGNKKILIDPVLRYMHYEQAYLSGELDAAFSQFTVWELRNVINSDAPDEQLSWGRESLRNYRPDVVWMDDVQFRYCGIVKSDVPYLNPVWYKEPRSYDQILSGGGKCGPRAWYGRFICKAFGIPVWGVRQTGHACMSRWTSQGWMTCFGKGFQHSYWGSRSGSDFLLETQARSAAESDEAYLQQVLRLEWMGQFCNENNKSVRGCMPDPKSPWWSLSLMQRKIMAAAAADVSDSSNRKGGKLVYPKSLQVTKAEQLKERPATCEVMANDGGTIIIPAATCSNTKGAVKFMDSFLGGKQLHLKPKTKLEYNLPSDLLTPSVKKYNLTCLICTVHRGEKPILLTVAKDSVGGAVAALSIEFHYTMGKWEETVPVVVELGGPDVTNTKLTFARQTKLNGITVKEIKLTPIEG